MYISAKYLYAGMYAKKVFQVFPYKFLVYFLTKVKHPEVFQSVFQEGSKVFRKFGDSRFWFFVDTEKGLTYGR